MIKFVSYSMTSDNSVKIYCKNVKWVLCIILQLKSKYTTKKKNIKINVPKKQHCMR